MHLPISDTVTDYQPSDEAQRAAEQAVRNFVRRLNWAAAKSLSARGQPGIAGPAPTHHEGTMRKPFGTASAASALFAIALTAHTANITLTWQAPTQRTDGAKLTTTEIKQYDAKCGSLAAAFKNTDTSGRIEADPGTYDCTLAAVDTNGQRSAPSNSMRVVVPTPPAAPDKSSYVTIFEPSGVPFALAWDLPDGKPTKWQLRQLRPPKGVVEQGTTATGNVQLSLPGSGFYVIEYWHPGKNRWWGSYDWNNGIRINGWSDKPHWWLRADPAKPKSITIE